MKTILAIDGGGIKGIAPAFFLAELCTRMRKRAHELFNMAAGTSTGGIIAVGVGCGVHHDSIVRMYRDQAGEIFQPRWRSLWGLRGPRYRVEGIESVLKATLGERPLGETLVPVGVTVARVSDHRSVFLTSWDHGTYLAWKAARSTSAAPVFFAPHDGYWDGGTWANNPSAAAYLRARRFWNGERIRVLSLGCGRRSSDVSPSSRRRAGLIQLAAELPSLLMEGGMEFVAAQMESELGADHLRINPDLNGASPVMDDISERHLCDLMHVARASVEDSVAEAIEWIETK